MEKLLNKKNFQKICLWFVFILAFGVRFYQLGSIPSSMNRDEPALGYNAYSILKIGKDEWGVKFPLSFKSFGDYKSPLYIYLTTIPVLILGLNEFSTRFLSALSGSLIVIVTYLLVRMLFDLGVKVRQRENDDSGSIIGLISAFLVAVSPWSIFFSRFAFEANLALCLNAFILYLLVKDNFKKINLLIILLTLLSIFAYSSSMIIWPIFFFCWLIYFVFNLFKDKSLLSLSEILKILLLILLIVLSLLSQVQVSGQKSKISVINNPQIRLDYNKLRTTIAKNDPWRAKLFYNQYFYYGKLLLLNYVNNFNLNFFFGGGGQHPWHKIPQTPHLYKIYLFLIPLGIIYLLKSSLISKEKKYCFFIFLAISIVPSAMTIDNPHATRLLNLFFFLTITAGFGLAWLFKKKKIIALVALLIVLISFIRFNKHYFIDYKKNPASSLLPDIKQVINWLIINQPKADRIIITDHADGFYIYYLFFSLYPPDQFLTRAKRYPSDTVGLEWLENLDNYTFTDYVVPNKNFKEIYILKNDNKINEKVIYEVKNSETGQKEYTVAANF